VCQGERGDRLYLIKDGAVDVAARGADGRDRHLATLGPTDYFGEIALLRDGPRTATVTARGPVELYTLSRADFQELLARAAEVRTSIGGAGEARFLETQSLLAPRL
jgi:CRP-like cAMP-binding protein